MHFIPELLNRFIETLNLKENQVIIPENSQLFVAIGAALSSVAEEPADFGLIIKRIDSLGDAPINESNRLNALFSGPDDYRAFRARHAEHSVVRRSLADYEGKCFLGIDAGSTTTKIALIDTGGALLYTYYGSNEGSPLKSTVQALKDLYCRLPPKAVADRRRMQGIKLYRIHQESPE